MNRKTSRRAFFASGSALIGASVATTAMAAPAVRPVGNAADREAIRALQVAFASAIERKAWDDAAALFADQASLRIGAVTADGRRSIREALANHDATDAPRHAAYRANSGLGDGIEVGERAALARFGVDVRVEAPLRPDCTAAVMASQQGLLADLHWESGFLEAACVRDAEGWKLDSLRYLPRD